MTAIAKTRLRTPARSVPALALLVLVAASGCYQEPNRFDKVQQETRRNAPAARLHPRNIRSYRFRRIPAVTPHM